jgi:hypothetical protein
MRTFLEHMVRQEWEIPSAFVWHLGKNALNCIGRVRTEIDKLQLVPRVMEVYVRHPM